MVVVDDEDLWTIFLPSNIDTGLSHFLFITSWK